MTPPKVLIRRKDRAEYILNGVCDYYKISREDIMKKRARTPELFKSKGVAIKILRDIADLRLKEISSLFDYGDESTTYRFYQETKEDREYNKVLNFLEI